jgi:hypothetical protein
LENLGESEVRLHTFLILALDSEELFTFTPRRLIAGGLNVLVFAAHLNRPSVLYCKHRTKLKFVKQIHVHCRKLFIAQNSQITVKQKDDQVLVQRSVSETFSAAMTLFSCALRIHQTRNQFLTSMCVRVCKKHFVNTAFLKIQEF